MKLYIHIGTEKTGSSFLQSYLSNNRELLINHGIFYPSAGKREADMKAGRISPGNASQLNELLDNQQWDKVEKWMLNLYNSANVKSCKKVLLSNEILVKTFSKPDVLKKFRDLSEALKFEFEPLLLIVREPVSQAMSLYKHRSKRGNMLPIKEWLSQKYILADCLSSFYNILNNSELSISQYPYKSESCYLANICLNNWLNLNEKIEVENTKVNPSLTLSELTLLSKIKNENDFLANQFYQKMLKIDLDQKSKDVFINDQISNEINNYMVQYNELWERVNFLMSSNDSFNKYSTVNTKSNAQILSFSEVQVSSIGKFINECGSINFFLEKLKTGLKKTILHILPNNSN